MSVDTQTIVDFIVTINNILTTPIQIAISLILLWQQLGLATLGGIGVMIIFVIPINVFITNKLKQIYARLMKVKDIRVKLINEILNGIKILKLYTWENSFEAKIKKYREIEIKSLICYIYWFSFMILFISGATFFVNE